jgi:hypothetical protein
MLGQDERHDEGYQPGRTLKDGDRVVLASVANLDAMSRGAASLELAITDRQANVATGAMPETDTCWRTLRPAYVLVLAQVVWQGARFAQDRRRGGLREVDGIDGDFLPSGRALPPDVTAGILATVRQRYPSGSAVEVSWEQQGDEPGGARYHTAFLLPRLHLPLQV